jgi:hypothetical protein
MSMTQHNQTEVLTTWFLMVRCPQAHCGVAGAWAVMYRHGGDEGSELLFCLLWVKIQSKTSNIYRDLVPTHSQ